MAVSNESVVLPPLSCVQPSTKSCVLGQPAIHPFSSLPPPLPSLQSICPNMDATRSLRLPSTVTRKHCRAISVPSMLPSQQSHNRLSMDDLLSAIDLDQKMRNYYNIERAKGVRRDLQRMHRTQNFKARRRSKSAPAAPPTYYRYSSCVEAELTQSIVQRHLEFSKRQ